MAARWVPESQAPISEREPIGRRLYAVPKLAGAQDQKLWKDRLEIDHFLEKRSPGDISLDRLGARFVDGKVRSYLLTRAEHAGTTFTPPKDFDGWAWVRAGILAQPGKGLNNYPVVASPLAHSDPQAIDCNPYHAHVCRPAGKTAYTAAMELRQLFHDEGDIEPAGRRRNCWWKYWRWALRSLSSLWRRP